MKPEEKKWLENLFGDKIRFNEPMHKHTSFHVGGPAQAYVKPESLDTFVELIQWADKNSIKYSVIGDGTNLLVKDIGVKQIVICLTKCLKEITLDRQLDDLALVTAMAGARMKNLCKFAIKNRLEGINLALGIPGTVGGGIMMNAGTVYGSISDILKSLTILMPDGKIQEIKRNSLCFNYRNLSWNNLNFKQNPIIIKGCFCLKKSLKSIEELENEAQKILLDRRKKQPLKFPNAGCFFKNPSSGQAAGKLIEMAGLKGQKIGGAQVSSKHANFIINRNKATGTDILNLADMIKNRVFKLFGVELQTEVKILD